MTSVCSGDDGALTVLAERESRYEDRLISDGSGAECVMNPSTQLTRDRVTKLKDLMVVVVVVVNGVQISSGY